MGYVENAKKLKQLTKVEPITEEQELAVKEKLNRAVGYITSFLVETINLHMYKHFWVGVNFAIQKDKELEKGVPTGHPLVFLHMEKHFSVFNRGGLTQGITSTIDLDFKGHISRDEFISFGLGSRVADPEFYYDYNTATGHIELVIAREEGLDSLLAGKLDASLRSILTLALLRYKDKQTDD